MSIKDTCPYQLVRKCYYSLKNWDETKESMRVRSKLRPFQNLHQGRACVVVGNGPSLKAEDLTRLHQLGIATFACNRIHLVFPLTPWRPTYYCMSDAKLIAQYDDYVEDVPAERRFFPVQNKDRVKNAIYYKTLGVDYNNEGKFSLNALEGIYQGCSVTTEMIQLAYYMGFSEIYLIGVDFSYAITKKVDDVAYEYRGENNYFIPGYLKPGEVADMPNVNANLLAFQAAREAIEGQDRIICNATRGGKLEVFQRVNLDDLFAKWEAEKK